MAKLLPRNIRYSISDPDKLAIFTQSCKFLFPQFKTDSMHFSSPWQKWKRIYLQKGRRSFLSFSVSRWSSSSPKWLLAANSFGSFLIWVGVLFSVQETELMLVCAICLPRMGPRQPRWLMVVEKSSQNTIMSRSQQKIFLPLKEGEIALGNSNSSSSNH